MAQTMAEGTDSVDLKPAFIDAPTVADHVVSAVANHHALLAPETASTIIDPDAVQELPATSDEMVGRTVGSYVVEDVLHEGRRGWLFRARPVAGGEPVALKFFHPTLAAQREGLLRAFHEAGAVGKLGHKHIVEVLAREAASPAQSYLILELLQGETLRGLFQRSGRLTSRRVVALALQVCQGLRAAHAAGFAHLDLRPERVFLAARESRDELTKVTGFGAHRLQEAARAAGLPFQVPISYRAPEMANLAPGADPAAPHLADIFSLGVVIYEGLSGSLPFPLDARGGAPRLATTQAIPLASVARNVDPLLEAAVMRCLSPAPEARFTSVEELEHALLAAVGATPSPRASSPFPAPDRSSAAAPGQGWKDVKTSPAPGAGSQRKGGRRMITIIITAIFTLCLAVAGVFALEHYMGKSKDKGPEVIEKLPAGTRATSPEPRATAEPTSEPTAVSESSPDSAVSPDAGAPDLALDTAPPAPPDPVVRKPARPRRRRRRARPRPRPKPRTRPRPKPTPKKRDNKIGKDAIKDPFAN